ncbi:MAG: DUF1588 domain-containing protein [Planctomycetes bacterium]|nr:DUF1588 domain-containing protein [Planctomycetota bacterium]MCP4860848.1 DUF1588 domain-containing protein [Planctomycetota bacterium]
MRCFALCLFTIGLLALPIGKAEAAAASAPTLLNNLQEPKAAPELDYERDVLDFLDNYCLSCHDGPDESGKLDLGAHEFPEDAREDPELYWLAAWKVWDHAMPPPRKRKQPSDKERAAFLAWVDAPDGLGHTPPQANTVLRRLNRSQYRRSIELLFNVTLSTDMVTNLPEDESGDGFDNIGASLTLSDEAFIRYLETAEYIAEQAIRIPFDEIPSQHYLGSELGSRTKNGTYAALWTRGDAFVDVFVEQPGRYRFKVGAFGNQAGDEACKMSLVVDRESVLHTEVPQNETAEGEFSKEITLGKGSHRLTARFLNDYYNPDAPNEEGKDRNLYISWLELEGPLDPPPETGFQRWLLGELKKHAGGSLNRGQYLNLIDKLVFHTWRRLPTAKEGELYLGIMESTPGELERKSRSCLIAVLLSPYFLFETSVQESPERTTSTAADKDNLRNGLELATHIALFLWSSYPDRDLLEAASTPDWIHDSEAITAQVNRMLQDPRANALAEDFASQCFRIRSLANHELDPTVFAGINDSIMDSMLEETYRFFMDNLRNNRNINELLTAEHSFLNQELAEHYGLKWHNNGTEWQRMALTGTGRRGILGQASILTVTSLPTRTAPVRRGKWIMENLLGAEPPPPPDNAGQLDESPKVVASAPLRERLAAHRDNPDCISCHMVMDPLGFSLENFDAVGRWREQDGAFPVDAGGKLPDGTKIEDLIELVEVIHARESFSRLLVSRLASYALGRTLVPGDRKMIQNLLDKMDSQNPSLEQAIQAIVASDAFRTRAPQ